MKSVRDGELVTVLERREFYRKIRVQGDATLRATSSTRKTSLEIRCRTRIPRGISIFRHDDNSAGFNLTT